MHTTGELLALFKLIDDPDDFIFDTVSNKIIAYGNEIVPQLEQLWEVSEEELVQKRIEILIHRVRFQDLQQRFLEWSDSDNPDLLRGAILLAQYQYPNLNVSEVLTQFDLFKRNIWLELNNYMSPLEQVFVFNTIIFEYYKLKGHELTERKTSLFFINNLFETKQGNAYSLGIVFLTLCNILDVPIFAINIPRQFIFAYIDTVNNYIFHEQEEIQKVKFFYDPVTGMIYKQSEVDDYLKKINASERHEYFKPIDNKNIIYKMMEELSLCYQYNHEINKADDIKSLMKMLTQ